MESLKGKIPEVILNKLISVDISSLESLLITNKNVFEENGLNSAQIDILLDTVSEIIISDKFQRAIDIPAWDRIRTGNKDIDNNLHGGIPIRGINEIYGSSGVGKTQFCLQLAITAQLPLELGGYNKDVLYICTEDLFPSKRLNQLVELFPQKLYSKRINKNLQDHIYVEHISDFEQLRICLCVRLKKLLEVANIGLIIIDSIAGIFRNHEKNNYFTRSQEFTIIAETLYNLADVHKIGILCTNQVTDDISTGKTEPCLGMAWSNYVTSRFCISRLGTTRIRQFEVVFSPDLPPTVCDFQINADGLSPVEDL